MNAPKYLQNTITEYSIVQNKLYGDYSRPARYDLLSVVMLCLVNPNDADYRNYEYQKLLRLLSVLASEKVEADEGNICIGVEKGFAPILFWSFERELCTKR